MARGSMFPFRNTAWFPAVPAITERVILDPFPLNEEARIIGVDHTIRTVFSVRFRHLITILTVVTSVMVIGFTVIDLIANPYDILLVAFALLFLPFVLFFLPFVLFFLLFVLFVCFKPARVTVVKEFTS